MDEDRIYIFATNDVTCLVDEDSERITTEIFPTDNPNKYIMQITAPVPRFLIKTARIDNGNSQESSS